MVQLNLKKSMSKTLTKEQALQRVIEIHGDNYDLSKFNYIDTKSKVTLGCKEHGFFEITFNKITTRKSGCQKCGMIKPSVTNIRSLEDVLSESKVKHNNFYDYSKVIEYKGRKNKHIITCPIHGDFEQTFDAHLSGKGCVKCGHKKTTEVTKITQEQAIDTFKKAHGDKYDYSLVEYTVSADKINIICKTHGVFNQKANNHSQGAGCPNCVSSVSKAELEIREFLEQYENVSYNRRDLLTSKKELDIVIDSKKIAVEYNGVYYHSDLFIDSNYHIEKTKDCNKSGLRLVHIFEDEWTYKKDIVKSRLLNILNRTPNKIYARNTIVKEVSSKDASKFLEDNHIQGKVNSSIRIGLYYKEELISLMTFSGLRKNLGQSAKNNHYELLRFCNKINTTIVGGASKLISHFEKKYTPEEIISYADIRWSEGNLYEVLDFIKVSITPPNYFYVEGSKRLNRFNFRKDLLVKAGYDETKTEKEIMKQRGYLRVYDCGAIKYKKEYLSKELEIN